MPVRETSRHSTFLISHRRALPAGIGILALVIAVTLPTIGISSYAIGQVQYVLVLIIVAQGMNIVTGYAGQLSLGSGAIFAIGAYTAAVLANSHPSVGLLGMIVAAVIVATAAGLATAMPALRVSGFYLGMVTLFLSLLVPTVARSLSITGGNNGISLLSNQNFSESLSTSGTYEVTLVLATVVCLSCAALVSSRLGRRFLTLRASEELAGSLGISVYRTKCFAFLLSALPAGLAGALYVYAEQFVSPGSVPPTLSVYVLAACVIGGLGTIWGPILGGVIVFGLDQGLSGSAQYQGIVFGVLLAAVVVLIPGGIVSLAQHPPGIAGGLARMWLPSRRPGGGTENAHAVISATSSQSLGTWTMAARPPEGVLAAEGLMRSFGGIRAVDRVDLQLASGEVHAVVGSNGSGKTTVINLLSGFYRLHGGSVRLDGTVISGRGPRFVAACGVVRTFQTPKLVTEESLLFNVMIAADRTIRCRDTAAVFRLPRGRRAERAAQEAATAALGALGLDQRRHEIAGEAPHGAQRLVEVARTLALQPRFILLDEPAAGLSEPEAKALGRLLKSIAGQGIGILLVEHNLEFVRGVADTVTMMHEGTVVAKGTPQQMDSNPLVSKLFIGDVASEGVAAGSPAPGSDEPYSAAAREGALPVASAKRDHSMAAMPNPPTPEPGTLNVRNLSAGYRRMTVVSDVCMTVAPGEIVALLGRNGAGKSTALLATAGTIRPHKGSVVELGGLALHGHRPEAIASRGLALVAQGHRVFPEMTVAENLRIGAFARRRLGRRVLDTDLSRVYDLFPVLKQFGQRPAGQLSGGQQQMVVIGQALMGKPKILMLDEPSGGLAPAVVGDVYRALARLRDDGIGLLVVEQDLDLALSRSTRAYVLGNGRIVVSGLSGDIRDEARKAMLGLTGDGR
jgi:branched-chain amino acid transport system ATP-binding protein